MNDEISEILVLQNYVSRYKSDEKAIINHRLTTALMLDYLEVKNLLDYITNLQQENEMLKDNAIHNDKVVDKARWNEMIYKSKVEKAVEYINNFSVDKSFSFPLMKRWEENQVKSSINYEFNDTLKKDLLNILQNGSEK